MEKPAGNRWWGAWGSTVPTKGGRRVVEAGLVFLVFGLATGRPSLFAGASLLLGLYAVGHLGAVYAGRSLLLSWDCPARVFAGESFPVRVTVRNAGRASIAGVEVHEPPPGGVRPAAVLARVDPEAALPVDVLARVRRRGYHRLAAPRLAVRWPLRLAVSICLAGEERDVLAYPRRVAVPPRALRSPAPETAARESAAAVPRGGELFRGVREWSPGDPPRSIAWRASARHGRLLTREFEREDTGRAVVVLDADARDLPAADRASAVERACSLAASLVLRLRTEGRRTAFAAWTPDPVLVPSVAGERALGRALEAMALLEAPGRRDPRRDPLALLPPGMLRGARVVVVKAATGPVRAARGTRGCEVVTVPAMRGAFHLGREA